MNYLASKINKYRITALIIWSLIVLVGLSPAQAAPSEVGGCFDDNLPRGETHSKITPVKKIEEPYFYNRSFDYQFVIIASPRDVLEALSGSDVRRQEKLNTLLDLLKKDMPLAANTDLFSYVISHPEVFMDVQRLSADLLEKGKAAVLDAGPGELLPMIEMERTNKGAVRTVKFYGTGNVFLIWRVDCIAH